MFSSFAVLALSVSGAYAHAFINSVEGANGVNGIGLGVTFNGEVARGGTGEQPFQLDTPVLKDTTTSMYYAHLGGNGKLISVQILAAPLSSPARSTSQSRWLPSSRRWAACPPSPPTAP